MNIMETDVLKMWEAYKEGDKYKESERAMLVAGMKQPFIENILFETFSNGCNAEFFNSLKNPPHEV